MTGKQFRTITRYIHIGVAILLALYFYMPSANNETMFTIIQLVAIPVVSITGIAMWQQPKILKLFRRQS